MKQLFLSFFFLGQNPQGIETERAKLPNNVTEFRGTDGTEAEVNLSPKPAPFILLKPASCQVIGAVRGPGTFVRLPGCEDQVGNPEISNSSSSWWSNGQQQKMGTNYRVLKCRWDFNSGTLNYGLFFVFTFLFLPLRKIHFLPWHELSPFLRADFLRTARKLPQGDTHSDSLGLKQGPMTWLLDTDNVPRQGECLLCIFVLCAWQVPTHGSLVTSPGTVSN